MAPTEFSKSQRIVYLISLYINGGIDFAELQELDHWRKEEKGNEALFQALLDQGQQKQAIEEMQSYDTAGNFQKIKEQITAQKNRRASFTFIYIKLMAAALVLIIIGFMAVFYFRSVPKPQVADLKPHPTYVAPGSDKAILTLANGKKIILGKNAGNIISIQAGIHAINSKTGKLTYTKDGKAGGNSVNIAFNTIETPRGGQYRLQLPDGTNVWLNAASSLSYPTNFTGRQREVQLTGEAYFEVVHNAKQPFVVKTATQTIYDVGTAFNLNAYSDEPAITTTLVEGAVEIRNAYKKVLLKPGQQAITASQTIKVSPSDVETATAWKNGQLAFHHSNIQNVLRQISRWYKIEVVYEGNVPDITISGGVSRQADLSAILKILRLSEVHFIQQGRKLIIKD